MTPYVDIHTHTTHSGAGCIEVVSLDIAELHTNCGGDVDAICQKVGSCGQYVAIGLHPWNAASAEVDLASLPTVIQRCPNVRFIGEAGLDRTRDIDTGLQKNVFQTQVEMSEDLSIPMVIHCVRAFDELLNMRKALKPHQRWIVHGFRGKPELARQLIRSGLDISLGEHYNPLSLGVIPMNRLWIETDMSESNIQSVYASLCENMNIDADTLRESVFQRFQHLMDAHKPTNSPKIVVN